MRVFLGILAISCICIGSFILLLDGLSLLDMTMPLLLQHGIQSDLSNQAEGVIRSTIGLGLVVIGSALGWLRTVVSRKPKGLE
jgi:uncharacterized protein YjeT (DUF2065 family)